MRYILWAISPEGRAVNLGEVLVGDNHRSKLDVTTDLQAFALLVIEIEVEFGNLAKPTTFGNEYLTYGGALLCRTPTQQCDRA